MTTSDKLPVSCPTCGATNNFPLAAEGKTVVCGRCRSPLPVPGRVVEATANELTTLVQSGRLPLLIDFFSPTCAPCFAMRPVVEGLARRRAGNLMVAQINADVDREMAAAFRIQAVPTFVLMRNGIEIGRISGAMPEADFALWVASRVG